MNHLLTTRVQTENRIKRKERQEIKTAQQAGWSHSLYPVSNLLEAKLIFRSLSVNSLFI